MESWTDTAVKIFLRCIRVYRKPGTYECTKNRYIRVYHLIYFSRSLVELQLAPYRRSKIENAQARNFWPKSADGAIDGDAPARQRSALRGRWQTCSTKMAAAKIKTGHYGSKPASTQS